MNTAASDFYTRVFDTRNDSPAARELSNLVHDLIDDVEDLNKLFSKVEAYVQDYSESVQAHFKRCATE
jgi:hypothetical protein